jgi:signal transduction histidine kinase
MKAKSTFGTNNEKGIGLGLMLCKEFTELQNGRIGFQSIPGKGTTFYISLISCLPATGPGVTMQKQSSNEIRN